VADRRKSAVIRAFPLRYNWAADVTINRSGKDVTLPGVATILRQLYGQPSPTMGPGSNAPAPRRANSRSEAQLRRLDQRAAHRYPAVG